MVKLQTWASECPRKFWKFQSISAVRRAPPYPPRPFSPRKRRKRGAQTWVGILQDMLTGSLRLKTVCTAPCDRLQPDKNHVHQTSLSLRLRGGKGRG